MEYQRFFVVCILLVISVSHHQCNSSSTECLLDHATDDDVDAVRFRLSEERKKRLLMENDIQHLTLKIAMLERKLDQHVDGRQVAFQAHTAQDYDGSTTDYYTVTFGSVALNLGSAYDNETGKFTAPVNGLYYFQGVLGTKPNKPWSFLTIRKNDSVTLCYTWSPVQKDWYQTTASTVVHLEKGDQVRVYLRGHMAHSSQPIYFHSVFSGFLVSAD